MTFFQRLERRTREAHSLLCVGLDPHDEDLRGQGKHGLVSFCRDLMEATAPSAAAFKPNVAFFEAHGAEGWSALKEVIASVPSKIPMILDAKRGDIGSTSAAYATAAFQELGADAITLSPYLGGDSITPFLQDTSRGVFVLCHTSNPSAWEFQEQVLMGQGTLSRAVALRVREWGHADQLGLVLGATSPRLIADIRKVCPEYWFLVPGIGTQGGDLAAVLREGLREDASGVLVNVSRSLARAHDPGAEAERLRLEIEEYRHGKQRDIADKVEPPWEVADALLEIGCVKFGRFTLKSGLVSPLYLDLRRLVGYPRVMGKVAQAYQQVLAGLSFDHIAALPYAALPIGTAVSLVSGHPLVYPRREAKNYGTSVLVEGVFRAGDRVVMLDDLATTGDSKVEAAEKLRGVGLEVEDVLVLIDRQSGASEMLSRVGLKLHAVFALTDLLARWSATGHMTEGQRNEVLAFLDSSRSPT